MTDRNIDGDAGEPCSPARRWATSSQDRIDDGLDGPEPIGFKTSLIMILHEVFGNISIWSEIMRPEHRKLLVPVLASMAMTVGLVGVSLASLPDAIHIVSQKGKRFGPQDLYLHSGEQATIVNDDGGLVHHAYIDSPELSFDSGDIEPGARAVITFPKAGDFTVLCGIHPKMKLIVVVR